MTNGTGVEGHRPARFGFWIDRNIDVSPPGLTPSKPINSNPPELAPCSGGLLCTVFLWDWSSNISRLWNPSSPKRKLTSP